MPATHLHLPTPSIQPEALERLAVHLDRLGINYYEHNTWCPEVISASVASRPLPRAILRAAPTARSSGKVRYGGTHGTIRPSCWSRRAARQAGQLPRPGLSRSACRPRSPSSPCLTGRLRSLSRQSRQARVAGVSAIGSPHALPSKVTQRRKRERVTYRSNLCSALANRRWGQSLVGGQAHQPRLARRGAKAASPRPKNLVLTHNHQLASTCHNNPPGTKISYRPCSHQPRPPIVRTDQAVRWSGSC